MKDNTTYRIVNFIVIAVAAVYFYMQYHYFDITGLLNNTIEVIVLLFTVIAVYIIKCVRLYLVMYGFEVSLKEHIKQFCKTIPVSVILPLKFGDIFRIFCYGHIMKDYLKASAAILFDRYVDTLGLVTTIILSCFIFGFGLPSLSVILLIFLLCLTLLYLSYSTIYNYWSKYLLQLKANKKNIQVLKYLNGTKNIMMRLDDIVKGRFVLMYFLSLFAWIVEISSIVLILHYTGSFEVEMHINNYLNAALGTGGSVYQWNFVIVSILVMVILCLGIHFRQLVRR